MQLPVPEKQVRQSVPEKQVRLPVPEKQVRQELLKMVQRYPAEFRHRWWSHQKDSEACRACGSLFDPAECC